MFISYFNIDSNITVEDFHQYMAARYDGDRDHDEGQFLIKLISVDDDNDDDGDDDDYDDDSDDGKLQTDFIFTLHSIQLFPQKKIHMIMKLIVLVIMMRVIFFIYILH